MEELEFDINQQSQFRPKTRSFKKTQAKFSVSNDKEFLESRLNSREKKAIFNYIHRKYKFHETKAKSEEKYTGGPLYQIFIAKYPALLTLSSRLSVNFERKSAKSPLFINSPVMKKSPQLKNFLIDDSPQMYDSAKESFRKKAKRKLDEKGKPCKKLRVFRVVYNLFDYITITINICKVPYLIKSAF